MVTKIYTALMAYVEKSPGWAAAVAMTLILTTGALLGFVAGQLGTDGLRDVLSKQQQEFVESVTRPIADTGNEMTNAIKELRQTMQLVLERIEDNSMRLENLEKERESSSPLPSTGEGEGEGADDG